MFLRSAWVVFRPNCNEFAQMMRPQDWRVSGQVIKVVHDDGHEQVEHNEGAQEDEGDKVHVREIAAAVVNLLNYFTYDDKYWTINIISLKISNLVENF